MKFIFKLLIIIPVGFGCRAQNNQTMENNNNPLLCDPAKGMCEIPAAGTDSKDVKTASVAKPVKLIYFTDPICSSCWGIEPQPEEGAPGPRKTVWQ